MTEQKGAERRTVETPTSVEEIIPLYEGWLEKLQELPEGHLAKLIAVISDRCGVTDAVFEARNKLPCTLLKHGRIVLESLASPVYWNIGNLSP